LRAAGFRPRTIPSAKKDSDLTRLYFFDYFVLDQHPSSAAYCVENMDLVCANGGVESIKASYVFTAKINVNVLSDLALFGKDAVAKRKMSLPERIEDVCDSFILACQGYLQLA
jgi:hypothetical protein